MAAGKKLFLSRSVRVLKTFVSFSRRKKVGEKKVHDVLDYAGCFSEAVGSVVRVSGWEAGLSDGLGYVHDSL